MFQTIELVADARHDARLHLLLMDVKASLVEGVAGIGEFVVHRSFPEDAQVVHEHDVIGTRCSFPSVSSDEGSKQGTVVHNAGSCVWVICMKKSLHENPTGREDHTRSTSE